MSLEDILMTIAEWHWENDEPISTDLHFRLASYGIDVPAAQEAYLTRFN